MAIFMKSIMINKVNIADLVTWEPDSTTGNYTHKTVNTGLPNFLNTNEFLAEDLC